MTGGAPAADRERVLLLECRLEEMRFALDAARTEADRARTKLAEASTHEADHARRYSLVHEELAGARTDLAALHRRLERSEALRREIAGHLFESGPRADAGELVRLRRKVLAEDQRALVNDRTVARLRERIEELVASRETLLTRIAEWQKLIREDGPGAADLSEFLAELRREILDLERENVRSDAREAALRARLAMAGIDPDGEPHPSSSTGRPAVREASVPAGVFGSPKVSDAPAAAESPKTSESPKTLEAQEASEAPKTSEAPEVTGASELSDGSDATSEFDRAPESGRPEPPAASGSTESDEPPAEPRVKDPARLSPRGLTWPPAAPADRTRALAAELGDVDAPALQAGLLVQLGRTGDVGAVDIIRSWTDAAEPSVRAAAYEAIGRLLEDAPGALEPYLRDGLADPDGRVRRRVVLATATARGILTHALLDPLREDPDPQVRRVIRQVLRQSEGGRFRSSRTVR